MNPQTFPLTPAVGDMGKLEPEQPLRVLIVEDSEDDTQLEVRALSHGGYAAQYLRVEEPDSLRAALHEASWDVVFIDHSLPHLNVPTVLALIRDEAPDLPCIIVSGTISEDLAVTAMKAGAADYLSKSRLNLLPSTVQRVLRDAEMRRARRQAEEALRASEATMRAMSAAMADAVIMIDCEDRILHWNPAAERIFGYSAAEVLGQRAHEILASESYREQFAVGLKEFAKTGQGPVIGRVREVEAVRKDGSHFPAEVSVSAFQVKNRWCAVGILRDITARKRDEETLRRSEERFRALVVKSSEGIALGDFTGRLLYLTESLTHLLGYQPEELHGHPVFDLIHPEDMERAQALLAECLNKPDQALGVEVRLHHKDGSWHHVEATVCNRLHDPCVQAIVANYRDVTARYQAEQERRELVLALKTSEERLRRVTDNMLDLLVEADADATVQYVSPSSQAFLGYRPEEMLGRTAFEFVHPEDQVRMTAIFEAGLKERKPGKAELRVRHADGRYIWVEKVGNPVLNERGEATGVVLANRDITDRKRLEEQLRQAQKMEAIGRLAGGIAHDFNNLLTVINGYSEVLLGTLPQGSRTREMADEIRKAGERAATLTRQLLAFSRKQVLQAVVLDVNNVVKELEKMLRRVIGEDIELTVALSPDLGKVMADPGQLEQVLMNLTVNARDAMPTGGQLTISTHNVELTEGHAIRGFPRCWDPSTAIGPHVLLEVRDTGCGMDETTLAHLFEPFFTTKAPGKGTGLGLATVYGIIRQSGGHIEVESVVGNGTAFRIYLPQTRKDSSPEKPRSVELAMPRGTETILLVEDQDAVRNLARLGLQAAGYTVLEAADGQQALAAAERHAGPLHLLLTDVVMPGMSGPQTADVLKTLRPDLKVLYLTGYADEAALQYSRLSQGAELLKKPFTLSLLARKVREVLDQTADPAAGQSRRDETQDGSGDGQAADRQVTLEDSVEARR